MFKRFLVKTTDTFKELFFIYFGTIGLIAFLFSRFEGKGYWDSLWWTFVTALTVGYGDMYPVTVGGRVVAIVVMHLVPFFIAPLIIGKVFQELVEDKNKFTDAEQENIKKKINKILDLVNKKDK